MIPAQSPLWHPYTTLTLSPYAEIVRGEGTRLYTRDGRVILDAISSWWVTLHGHSHPVIAAAIARQAATLEQVIFAGFSHEPALTLAHLLLEALPTGFSKIFYSDNGSTSVEVAIKMALQYWHNRGISGRKKIIAFENAYHGDTFGAMSVSGKSAFTAPFEDLLFEVITIPLPSAENIDRLCEKIETLAQKEDIAAFIYEPLVQGAAGMQMYESRHLHELVKVAKQNNLLCIADEVMTGFGRTGAFLAGPPAADLICLSKGITGGFLPLGVTAVHSKVVEAFLDARAEKTFFHGHSYTANPISCAASIASWQLLQEENCRRQIDLISLKHRLFVQSLTNESRVQNARSSGTILAFDIKTREQTSYFNSIKSGIMQYSLDAGVLLRPLGNILYAMPPYSTTEAELEHIYGVMNECIARYSR